MKIAELFVALGVKGSEQSIGAVTGVTKGLKETWSTGLAAKAAIVGVLYAMNRLFSSSAQFGAGLKNFNAAFGVSARTLQQYQYAARQVNATNQTVENSFRGLQSAATKALTNQGAPSGTARVAQFLGMAPEQMIGLFSEAASGRPELLLQALQKYAQLDKDIGLRNESLKSFGVGEDMVAALDRNAFRPEVLDRAPLYSDKEVQNLDKVQVKLANLSNQIEMTFGRFTAKHGEDIIKGISDITGEVLSLVNALIKLEEKVGVFGWLAEGLMFATKGLSKGTQGVIDAATSDDKSVWDYLKENSAFYQLFKARDELEKARNEANKPAALPRVAPSGGLIKPQTAPGAITPGQQGAQINVNQTFNIDGGDPNEVAGVTKRAVQSAFRQMYTQSQVG